MICNINLGIRLVYDARWEAGAGRGYRGRLWRGAHGRRWSWDLDHAWNLGTRPWKDVVDMTSLLWRHGAHADHLLSEAVPGRRGACDWQCAAVRRAWEKRGSQLEGAGGGRRVWVVYGKGSKATAACLLLQMGQRKGGVEKGVAAEALRTWRPGQSFRART